MTTDQILIESLRRTIEKKEYEIRGQQILLGASENEMHRLTRVIASHDYAQKVRVFWLIAITIALLTSLIF